MERSGCATCGAEVLTIIQVSRPDDVEIVRNLFLEYQALLGVDLCFQDFESEVRDLPGEYVPPSGRLFLARNDGAPVGCVALRAFHGSRCEMKRLFARPAARGLGVGRALVTRVMDEARAIGYAEMVLDTLPTMTEAQHLYLAFGFHPIPPYRPNPVPGALFMGREL